MGVAAAPLFATVQLTLIGWPGRPVAGAVTLLTARSGYSATIELRVRLVLLFNSASRPSRNSKTRLPESRNSATSILPAPAGPSGSVKLAERERDWPTAIGPFASADGFK